MGILAGCGGAASEQATPNACDPGPGEKVCDRSDDRLHACVAFTTGLYGAAHTVCGGGGSGCGGLVAQPSYAPDGICTDSLGVRATIAGGATHPSVVHGGVYSVELPPGTYDVCPDVTASPDHVQCVSVEVVAGQLRRVDLVEVESLQGTFYRAQLPE